MYLLHGFWMLHIICPNFDNLLVKISTSVVSKIPVATSAPSKMVSLNPLGMLYSIIWNPFLGQCYKCLFNKRSISVLPWKSQSKCFVHSNMHSINLLPLSSILYSQNCELSLNWNLWFKKLNNSKNKSLWTKHVWPFFCFVSVSTSLLAFALGLTISGIFHSYFSWCVCSGSITNVGYFDF